MSCKRTQEFLAKNEIATDQLRSATKEPVLAEEVTELLAGASELVVAKGRRTVRVALEGEERPSEEELVGLVVGRSGKLRAPAMRVGGTLAVGFNRTMLEELFEAGADSPE